MKEQESIISDNLESSDEDRSPSENRWPTKNYGENIIKNLDPVGAYKRVIAEAGTKFKYVTDKKKLLVYDGKRYGDFPYLAENIILEVLNNVHNEYCSGMINKTEDGEQVDIKGILNFQKRLRTKGMLHQVMQLICLDKTIQTDSSKFDANPNEFNVENGLLNLETKKLTEHSPLQLVTKCAPVSWNPEAKCPHFEDHVRAMTKNNKDMYLYHQRLGGSFLAGGSQDEVLPIFYGTGGNGKSKYLEAICNVLGYEEYVHILIQDTLLNNNGHGKNYDIMQLEGKRLACAIEVNKGQCLNEAVVKTLTGGDRIAARGIYQSPARFKMQATIILVVNTLPILIGNDHAIHRRIQVVPFPKTFDGTKNKFELEDELGKEKEGILVWLVNGYHEWREHGLNPPDMVRKATENYFKENDQIGMYLDERTVEHENNETPIRILYNDYRSWARDNGYVSIGMHQFSSMLTSRGKQQKRKKDVRVWCDISLKPII